MRIYREIKGQKYSNANALAKPFDEGMDEVECKELTANYYSP